MSKKSCFKEDFRDYPGNKTALKIFLDGGVKIVLRGAGNEREADFDDGEDR